MASVEHVLASGNEPHITRFIPAIDINSVEFERRVVPTGNGLYIPQESPAVVAPLLAYGNTALAIVLKHSVSRVVATSDRRR